MMAPTPSTGRRPFNTRGRSARKSVQRATSAESPLRAEPPLKRRRYVPGGPGGGGRYLDTDGTEVPVGGTGPGGYNYVGQRGRVGRENAANGVQPVAYPRPRRESRRERVPARPRFSSAAAAAAAVVHGDGFKPREERGWEEFHQDLDIEAKFPVFSADEVDGIKKPTSQSYFDDGVGSGLKRIMTVNGETQVNENRHRTPSASDEIHGSTSPKAAESTPRRRPGRPPRRADSMLKGIGPTPEAPKVIPLPGFNPREKLMLPKPAFRTLDPFVKYEQKGVGQLNYVDRSMANVGYQESEVFIRPEKRLIRVTEGNIEDDLDVGHGAMDDGGNNTAIVSAGVGRVEYDMDEQDFHWLEAQNEQRKIEQADAIKPAIFEVTMTKIEKEWHALEKRIPKPNPKPPQTHRPRSSSAAAVNGELPFPGEEQDSKCAICDDGDCENTNAIVFCDGCDLAVHQECYGVPFIPEGQWLCRKCQLIGRGTPTCIFCPNTDGAFKQTNASRWSHLLCAIWIPEVSIGNATFMEPVMDVEKVPKPRWKLTCYICRQKMGACIQCGNKNCYIAFHVTCARRARLFLKMKSSHGGPASLDASVLKAYCDKHVPADWRREHDVDTAITDAMEYYRYTMRGRLWADSQQSALTIMPAPSQEPSVPEPTEEASNQKITLNLNPKNRSRKQTPKVVWRLPSGAPVIPIAVYNSVESSLVRFSIRRRKEFAADMCKYWTLKREARRGAALLKRLQLQMETFTSMEITRRNFIGMGAAGGVRLQRRIDFAETLLQDVEKIRELCATIKERELEKLKDAEMMRGIVDTVYFPIAPLLWPILEKAQSFDGKGVFKEGFSSLRQKLNTRSYNTVQAFSADFGAVFSELIGLSMPTDSTEVQVNIIDDVSAKDLLHDHKMKKALAKRIIKAVQGSLEDAVRKESELLRKPFEKELRDLDLLLEKSIASRRDSINGSLVDDVAGTVPDVSELSLTRMNGVDEGINGHSDIDPALMRPYRQDMPAMEPIQTLADSKPTKQSDNGHRPTPESMPSSNSFPADDPTVNEQGGGAESLQQKKRARDAEPPTPPMSSEGDNQPTRNGGIPWYMETFDPVGTTIQEERWTGRDLVRGMSEDLSDMDDEELSGLVDVDELEVGNDTTNSTSQVQASAAEKKRKAAAKRKRWRGFR